MCGSSFGFAVSGNEAGQPLLYLCVTIVFIMRRSIAALNSVYVSEWNSCFWLKEHASKCLNVDYQLLVNWIRVASLLPNGFMISSLKVCLLSGHQSSHLKSLMPGLYCNVFSVHPSSVTKDQHLPRVKCSNLSTYCFFSPEGSMEHSLMNIFDEFMSTLWVALGTLVQVWKCPRLL